MSWTSTSTSYNIKNKNSSRGSHDGNNGQGHVVVGPFVSGVPTEVPLWVAKTLYSRRLAQVEVPDWLTAQRLKMVIKEERTSPLLSKQLPFYYYEISLALKWLVDPQCQVLLQDLSSIRLDKLRQNFQEISRDTLEEPQGLVGDDDDEDDYEDDDEDGGYYGGRNNRNSNRNNNSKGDNNDDFGAGRDVLPTIDITGIASYELNKVGPFFQRAFSDYGFLTTRMSERLYEKYHGDNDDDDDDEDDHDEDEEVPNRMEDEDVTEQQKYGPGGYDDDHHDDGEGEGDDDYDHDDHHTSRRSVDKGNDSVAASGTASGSGGTTTTRRIVGGRSRLRRFR